MHDIKRQVWGEARAMTRREVVTKAIAKQLSWVQASEILGISARHMRRLRRNVERWGMSAVLDQRGGRPRRTPTYAHTTKPPPPPLPNAHTRSSSPPFFLPF